MEIFGKNLDLSIEMGLIANTMKHFTVEGAAVGKRMDLYLSEKTSQSRKAIKQLLDGGRVKLNGRRVSIAKWELKAGDIIELAADKQSERDRERRAGHKFIEVLFEDRDVIVVIKEAGIPVMDDAEGAPYTLVDQVRAYLRRKHPGSRGTFVKPVHRLDSDTSGVMVLAKSKIGEKLIAQFTKHTIRRLYQAVVRGRIESEQGKIDLPLAKGDFGFGKKAAVTPEGKPSRTDFRVLERYLDATYVELELHTGRTHQVRVHLAAKGHPIIGDALYGYEGSKNVAFPRQALHASLIRFTHPVSHERMEFKAPLPKDMEKLIDELRMGC